MNVSQPVASTIKAVSFGILSSEEIKKLSVKQITSPVSLDALLHPTPGGLYDPALGAFMDHNCSTCHLDVRTCPGHCGHIELPVYLYNSIFLPQAFLLLRAHCLFCNQLKLARIEVHRFVCKLRLIGHGLVNEAQKVDDIEITENSRNEAGSSSEDSDEESQGGAKGNDLMRRRDAFVKHCLARNSGLHEAENETVSQMRSTIVGEFLRSMTKKAECSRCKGVNPRYRKSGSTSIFRKALNEKQRAKNVQNGLLSFENPLAAQPRTAKSQNLREKRATSSRHAHPEHSDEGVADLESSLDEDDNDITVLAPPLLGEESSEESEHDDSQAQSSGFVDDTSSTKKTGASKMATETEKEAYISPNDVHAALTRLFEHEKEIFSLIYRSSTGQGKRRPPSADMFFIKCLLVPPNKYRKEMSTGPEEIAESQDNASYRKILSTCDDLYQIRREMQGILDEGRHTARTFTDLQRVWVSLQEHVNGVFDKDKNPVRAAAAAQSPDGIKQKLEKKEGLFRGNIMGKRVNFAARSVISPDPNLETNEIGIPPVFAKKLTYPEAVTSHNFEELRQAVIRGPDQWPGAVAIEHENGQVTSLQHKSEEDRQAIANTLLAPSSINVTGVRNKKVHRHLNNGDIVIMNRQPTLHKPSMMAHRAKVLPREKTIRLHYANCNTYNADFDGDEMNMHFPQNEVARAEALQIADTDHQYLSATAGSPLRGLIQDHISMSVWLTCEDTFFNRSQYQELLYSCLRPESNHTESDRILLMEPTILKPAPTWTGKQVISTILKNITPPSHTPLHVTSQSGTLADRWWPTLSQEGEVRVVNGEFLTGILDKKQIGPSAGGFIHTVYEAYGHIVAGKLMSILSRLLTKLLNMRAFSCGVEDIVLTANGEKNRTKELLHADALGLAVASKYVSLQDSEPSPEDLELSRRLEEVLRDDGKQAGLDAVMNSRTSDLSSEITRICLPDALHKDFPRNQMQLMTATGAKGSMVNANFISCNLGQQVLEGRRVPTMISGKTLPCFRAFETSIRAGGYIVDRFLTGIRPQEYYFHAMAGREGLIDTAVKTSRSGYLQRCLVKGMEGLRVEYDTSVRDADGSLIQTLYGEDGLDITRQRNLLDFRFQSKNFMSLYAGLDVREMGPKTIKQEAIDFSKRATRSFRRHGEDSKEDPSLSVYPPATYAGSVSEKFYMEADKYISTNPDKTIRSKGEKDEAKVKKNNFWDMLYVNYMKAVVHSGETVGVIAAQSIGEPSTQMTLNTFHLAGHSAKNVTLGIPRLREILMTASKKIKTPTMSVFPIPNLPKEQWEQFAKGLSRVTLGELIDTIQVRERAGDGEAEGSRMYEVRMNFYPAEEYAKDYGVQIRDVQKTIEDQFLPELIRLGKREMKKHAQEKSLKVVGHSDAHPDLGKGQRPAREDQPVPESSNREAEADDSDEEDDEEDTEDAGYTRRKANRNDDIDYDDPDEDEDEIARMNEREESPEVEQEDEGYGGSPRTSEAPSDSEEEAGPASAEAKEREQSIRQRFAQLTSFYFDDRQGAYCTLSIKYPMKIMLLPVATKAAHRALVQSIDNLASCLLSIEKDADGNKIPIVHTQGVNFKAMAEYQHIINPHHTLSNDIGAILSFYGVEAARATIIQELREVFTGHSIAVDARHLSLIADYMTRDGDFSPFNRHGMAFKTGPLAKMSFESTVRIIAEAAMSGETDNLKDPSALISVGQLGRMGTGMFEVLTPVGNGSAETADTEMEDEEL